MIVTSAQANKFLNKLNDDLKYLLNKEAQSCIFNAAVGEDIESVRPEYSYGDTQTKIDELAEKIRKVKHAINIFNTTTVIPELQITIDEALVLIPQLSKKKSKLGEMKARLPKERVRSSYGANIIDYHIINYDLERVSKDYDEVSEYLARVQNALDAVNSTITFEIVL